MARSFRLARKVLTVAGLAAFGSSFVAAAPPQILVYYAVSTLFASESLHSFSGILSSKDDVDPEPRPLQTAGYYHESIPAAIDALQNIGATSSLYNATFSKDESLFTPDQLRPYSAIVFLSNSDQVLTDTGEQALSQWLTQGGSLVGLHAGTACLFNDTAFGTAMGAWAHRT